MAKRASIDANGLLRLLLNDVPEQSQAVIDLLAQGTVFDVADMVIAEVVFVLMGHYGFTRAETAEAVTRILTDAQFNCNARMFKKALELYAHRPALSFVDCCAVYYAELNEALPLHTFDKKLANQSNGLAKLIR